MIYIKENGFKRQMALLKLLAQRESYSICAWLYPESKAKTIAGYDLMNSNLEPVTTYSDGTISKHTQPVICTPSALESFAEAKNKLVKNVDSLILYREGETEWFAATIGHEGMCLIRDKDLYSYVLESGFNASLEAPSWW